MQSISRLFAIVIILVLGVGHQRFTCRLCPNLNLSEISEDPLLNLLFVKIAKCKRLRYTCEILKPCSRASGTVSVSGSGRVQCWSMVTLPWSLKIDPLSILKCLTRPSKNIGDGSLIYSAMLHVCDMIREWFKMTQDLNRTYVYWKLFVSQIFILSQSNGLYTLHGNGTGTGTRTV